MVSMIPSQNVGDSGGSNVKDDTGGHIIEQLKPIIDTNKPEAHSESDKRIATLDITSTPEKPVAPETPSTPSEGSNAPSNVIGPSWYLPREHFDSEEDEMTTEEVIAKIEEIRKRPSRKSTFGKLLASTRHFRKDVHDELDAPRLAVHQSTRVKGRGRAIMDNWELPEHVTPIVHNGQLAFVSHSNSTLYQPFKPDSTFEQEHVEGKRALTSPGKGPTTLLYYKVHEDIRLHALSP